MLNVEVLPILGDNYAYLVVCDETGQAAAVDPSDASRVAARAHELNLDLVAIWNTHHHFDHTGGNEELCRGRALEVVGHQRDEGRIPGLTRTVKHGDRFALGNLDVEVLHTPGHTLGAVCYRVANALFTGDTVFGAGCGRLFEGDAPMMFKSLSEVLEPLPRSTRVYFGHEYTEKNLDFAARVEPNNERLKARRAEARELRAAGRPTTPSRWGLELDTNPFLRAGSRSIANTLRLHYPDDELTPLRVFTRLRQMRNSW